MCKTVRPYPSGMGQPPREREVRSVRGSWWWIWAFAVVLGHPAKASAQVTGQAFPALAEAARTPAHEPANGAGQQPGAGADSTQESRYDRIWSFAQWYANDSNPIVQRMVFSGRFHHEFAAVDADAGDHDEWNIRRVRLGPRLTLFRTFLFHAEVELNPQERDPLYVRFTDFYVQWSTSGRFALTVGKQSVPFTGDGSTSSKELLTIDRNNLSNNIWFPQEYMPGVSVSGRRAPWMYRVGAYSGGQANREFGEFNGSVFTLGVLGYDFGPALGVREALLTGSYVYQHPDEANTFTRQLQHIASVNIRVEAERAGVRSDVSAAAGYLDQSDLWGVTVMPFLNLTDKLQAVARYTIIESGHPNGVRLATYENRVEPGRGDQYTELYLGASYYFYGHRLKLQSGAQFAEMADRADDGGVYSGWSWIAGLRIGWP